tara:strand:- start:245 stop:1342 length:1098 start_codon:yes stop_codon:yes gene_type:complete
MENVIRFLDLSIPVREQELYLSAIKKVLDHGQLVLGNEVDELENALCEYTNRKYCLAVSSGSDALFLALRALNISKGDEVITSPLSWIATANAIKMCQAEPIFADIDNSLNIDVQSIEQLITANTKAIVSVDFTGRLCDYKTLEKICKKYSLLLVEDGSQAFGAKDCNNKLCGSFGDVSAISHNPMKVFSAFGEAGTIYTDNKEIYDRLKILRYAGTINKETCIVESLNHRMDTLQASILLERLRNLDNNVLKPRIRNAKYYDQSITNKVIKPVINKNETHVYYTYTLITDQREELQKHLSAKGIETKVQHRIPMHSQPLYRSKSSQLKRYADELVKNILCIPVHEKLTLNQINYVSQSINEFYS